MSKGDKQRPTDLAKYAENYDAIFKKTEDDRRADLDRADLEAIVRPVERVCGNCRHWVEQSHRKNRCDNDNVLDMVDAVEWSPFEPPADFGCNRFQQ